MDEQSICAQTVHVTKVSTYDQINAFKSETEQIDRLCSNCARDQSFLM